MSTIEQAGFVGLGVMGRPMARNLARKYPVTGYDVAEARFQDLGEVTRAGSLSELARHCQVVLLSLPNAAIVEEVTIGVKGIIQDLTPGSLVIDLSTNLPAVSRRIAARLAERGIDFADAPVSGGEGGAKAAALAIMVGAGMAVFERSRPLLSTMGKTVVRVGEVGAGCVAKLVNNMIVASAFAVIAEGFALAGRNGVDTQSLYDAIREGWAGSKVLDVSAAAIVARDYTPGGTINMMEKDLGYARAMAAESAVPIPMTAAAHEVFVAGQAAGRGALSQPAIIELWRRERTVS
ncbi:MAG: NAD(P)-binding domain-containing protein [Spirochaetia bacterium]